MTLEITTWVILYSRSCSELQDIFPKVLIIDEEVAESKSVVRIALNW